MRVAMGDVSAEPSMEEILSSIKRIIAEEGEGTRAPARRSQRAPVVLPEPEEVLELSEPIPVRAPVQPPRAAEPARAAERPRTPDFPAAMRASEPAEHHAPQPQAAAEPSVARAPSPDPIVSQAAAAASRGSLDALSRAVVKPEAPAADATLEGMVREMLRPMLRDWLDARLPEIVEAMVAREIERITGSR